MPTQASKDVVQIMYIAYYGRPADTAGLEFWATSLDNLGTGDLQALVDSFGTSPEFTDRFGSQPPDQLVENIYHFLFSRAADQGGKDFYVGRLTAGESSLATIALEILVGSQNEDRTTIENKWLTASYFTTNVQVSGAGYGGGEIEAARSMLAGVGASGPDLEAAGNTLQSFPGGGGFRYVTGTTFGDDTIVADFGGRDILIGLAGADTFKFQSGASTVPSLDKVGDYNRSEGDKIDIGGVVAPNVTDFDVNSALDGNGEVRATIVNGIITVFGADAGAINDLSLWGKVGAAGLLAPDEAAGFEFLGSTFLLQNDSNININMVELTGLTGISALSDAGDGSIFIG